MIIRAIDQKEREPINAFIVRQWYTAQMVVHGESIDLASADGFYACESNEITGLITYRLSGKEMEILSLDSLHERQGTGSALLNEAIIKAKDIGAERIKLITTNDNLPAMRFYQKRGFHRTRLYRNAVEQARKLKPEIPLIGMDGIPLEDEIEFEMEL
ncbi:MAG: GNAT family N-acetyltransferase [Clostridia bacterium]|nr:GNAT family N-acetyltransferase [Clostridia bacterium]